MRAVICTNPGTLDLIDQPEPIAREGTAIIKIKRVGICGTDLHAYKGSQPFFSYPRIFGHELAGELVDTGGAETFEINEAVTVMPYFNCGTCIACRNGTPNCCVHIKVCGVHIDGAMAEYFAVPTTSLVKSGGLGFDELALVEPLAIGAHGVKRAFIKQGEFVLVIGAGPIGLGTMEFARIAGANVIAMDVNSDRLQFCNSKLAVSHIINAAQENVMERLKAITGNNMPTVVIDATGNQQAINGALQYLAHGGRIVLVGLQKEMIGFSHPEFHKREATLMSSRNATRENFTEVIHAMQKGWIQPATYITHRLNFPDIKDGFERALDPVNGTIKAMIQFDD